MILRDFFADFDTYIHICIFNNVLCLQKRLFCLQNLFALFVRIGIKRELIKLADSSVKTEK